MRPNKTRKPFTLYKKETQAGPVWYVRFWDENNCRYAVTRSTGIRVEGKKERRYEAEQTAREMLSLIRFATAATDKSFIQYVADFWLPDSPYVREYALVKKKPLKTAYINLHHEDVRRHIKPFPGFQGINLWQLTPGHIRDWMRWMAEKGMKGGRINKVMQAMSVAVRYAVAREELERDPFKNIKEAPDARKEKGIISPAELTKLINNPVTDTQGRLAVLLGALCGFRLGEVRGLLWGDIGEDIINVCHNYQNDDGLTAPKWNSSGVLPITATLRKAIDAARKLAIDPRPESFVMESPYCSGKPYSKNFFAKILERELEAIGIPGKWRPTPHKGRKLTAEEKNPPAGYVNEQERRNLTFHSLRHTFVTLGRIAGLSLLEIQTLARHKSGAMTERYTHAGQVLDFASAKEKLEKAIGA
jgi:integrase